MTIIIDPYIIPEKGKVELSLQRSFEIQVTAEEARYKVRWWLRDEVSMFLEANPPLLVVGEQVVWRIPVVLVRLALVRRVLSVLLKSMLPPEK